MVLEVVVETAAAIHPDGKCALTDARDREKQTHRKSNKKQWFLRETVCLFFR